MEFTSTDGEKRYAELVQAASRAIVGLDFDGTLSPIVDDPESAHIHDDAPELLVELARAARALALDLGIRRTVPAVDPMKLDRLTVILTADHA